MGPFDRFNDAAKRVLALAQDEAIRFNHNYIGTEHILLGLIREGEGLAARVLATLGVELSKARTGVEFVIGRGDAATSPSEIILSPRTKKVIELAIDESRKLGHGHVGTEHLLLGLIREGQGIASGILESLGVRLDAARQEVLRRLGGPVDAPGPAEDLFRDAQGKKRDWYCEDVLSGKMKVEVVWEDERVLAFKHPFPESPVHAVVIPKAHVGSLLAPEALDPALLASMLRAVQTAATALGLDREGFQLRANAAAPGVTPHMHWHVRGPGLPPPERPRPEWTHRTYVTAVGPGTAGWTQTPYGKVHGSPSVFDRFDESGRTVLKAALDEAMRFRHNYVGTEHLLLGVLRDDGMAPLLAGLPVDLDKARRSVEAAIGRGGSPTTPAEVHLTPRTTKVLELARAEADRLGRPRVGAREVLLGIIREGGGVASQVLASLGVDAAALKERIEKEPPPKA